VKKVYIIVLNYHGYNDTVECIKSLLQLNYKNYQIIVVDNSDTKEEFDKFKINYQNMDFFEEYNIQQSNKKIIFIKALENKGFSTGNNIGIKYAFFNEESDYIWVLNNDTVVKEDSLTYLVDKMENSPNYVGFLGNKLLYYNSDLLQGLGGKYNKFIAQSTTLGVFEKDKGQYDTDDIKNQVDYPIGASLFFKKDCLLEVGLLNETYFLYFEEMDYVLRAKNMGWHFDICYKSKVWHKEGQSTNQDLNIRSEFVDCINLKNRILFTKRYFICYLPFVYLSFIPVFFNRILRKRLHIIKAIFKEC